MTASMSRRHCPEEEHRSQKATLVESRASHASVATFGAGHHGVHAIPTGSCFPRK
jgi:hypothetical protein